MAGKKLEIQIKVILLTIFILLLAGCRAETINEKPSKLPRSRPKEPDRKRSLTKSETIRQGFKLITQVRKEYYAPQEEIKVKMTLTNFRKQIVTVTFGSGQRFDLAVRNEQGEEIYRWSADKHFTMMVEQIRLEPNQNIDQDLTFFGSQGGKYKIVGETVKFSYDEKESLKIETPPIEITLKK